MQRHGGERARAWQCSFGTSASYRLSIATNLAKRSMVCPFLTMGKVGVYLRGVEAGYFTFPAFLTIAVCMLTLSCSCY